MLNKKNSCQSWLLAFHFLRLGGSGNKVFKHDSQGNLHKNIGFHRNIIEHHLHMEFSPCFWLRNFDVQIRTSHCVKNWPTKSLELQMASRVFRKQRSFSDLVNVGGSTGEPRPNSRDRAATVASKWTSPATDQTDLTQPAWQNHAKHPKTIANLRYI